MDQPRSNLRESERGMECVRVRIWWIDVDLTNDLIVTGVHCLAEQLEIQILGNAAPSRLGRYDDTVHVNEPGKMGLKPQKISASPTLPAKNAAATR
jgi:hypothetical protein